MIAWITIPIVAISVWGVLEIIKIGTRYSENKQRILHGYPTLDGSLPGKRSGGEPEFIDMTDDNLKGN